MGKRIIVRFHVGDNVLDFVHCMVCWLRVPIYVSDNVEEGGLFKI